MILQSMYNRGFGAFFAPLSHIKHIITDKHYRELYKLKYKFGNFPRYKETRIGFDNYEFVVPDVASFLSTYEELFINEIYKFTANKKESVIIDFGANIGLSVLYFARQYEHAIIEAYEADPIIFAYLEENVKWGGENIKIYNNAVWTENKVLNFYSEGADGGRIEMNDSNNGFTVNAIDSKYILAKYEKIDLLKMDVEGAEGKIIPHIASELNKVSNIFVEYHSTCDEKQDLRAIIDVLDNSGFRLYMNTIFCPQNPFLKKDRHSGFDLQINIWGIRESKAK